MAEFCPECWNSINGYSDPPEAYVLTWDFELCEGYGKWKRTVIRKRRHYLLHILLNRLLRR